MLQRVSAFISMRLRQPWSSREQTYRQQSMRQTGVVIQKILAARCTWPVCNLCSRTGARRFYHGAPSFNAFNRRDGHKPHGGMSMTGQNNLIARFRAPDEFRQQSPCFSHRNTHSTSNLAGRFGFQRIGQLMVNFQQRAMLTPLRCCLRTDLRQSRSGAPSGKKCRNRRASSTASAKDGRASSRAR